MSKEAYYEYLKIIESPYLTNFTFPSFNLQLTNLYGKAKTMVDYILWTLAITGVISTLILFKNNVTLDLGTFKAEVWIPALATLLVGGAALYAAAKNVQKIQVQIDLQEIQIQDQKNFIETEALRNMLANYIEIENLPSAIRSRSKHLQQTLRDITESLENLAKDENIELHEAFNKHPTDKSKEYYIDVLNNALNIADFKIEIPSDTKIYLSRSTRKAAANINSRFLSVKNNLEYRIANFETLKSLSFKGYGLLYHHYEGFTKEYIDEFSFGVEQLRRQSEKMDDISNLADWKKGIEIIPQDNTYILKHYRFPKMTAKFKNKSNPVNKDFLDFSDIESAELDEISNIQTHMNLVVQSLAIMKKNDLAEPASYFDVYKQNIGSVNPGYKIHVIYPL